jgi:hypothetical protein
VFKPLPGGELFDVFWSLPLPLQGNGTADLDDRLL